MTPLGRWSVVALLVALTLGVPQVVRHWPVASDDVSAADLLGRVQAAGGHAYSGYVETSGTVKLPVGDQFSDLGGLFGEVSRLRVWWHDDDEWRVDRLDTTGESDLVHRQATTTQYDYSDARATTSRDPAIRLPRAADLVPPVLAGTVLDGATAAEVTRLPSARVAGVDAPGLRLDPASDQTSIDHVDLWVDPASGVPLRLDVYGIGDDRAAFTSSFLDFSSATPDPSLVSFERPDGVEGQFQDALDIADAANQFAPIVPPTTVAGLARSSSTQGAVGVYGTGVTRFIAIPVRSEEGDPLRTQLAKVPGVKTTDDATSVAVGPLSVLVTGHPGDGGWVVAGTVTLATLRQAAADLVSGSRYVGFDR